MTILIWLPSFQTELQYLGVPKQSIKKERDERINGSLCAQKANCWKQCGSGVRIVTKSQEFLCCVSDIDLFFPFGY